MSTLSLSCFGPPRVELDGQPVRIANQKALALLIYLAVTGATQRRDSLATLLWPECGRHHARTYLRQALHALTQTLGDHPFETSRETIGLCPDAHLHVDVRQFQTECDAIAKTKENELTLADVTQFETTVALYRDGFLVGFTLPDSPQFDQWCRLQAESLRRNLAQALQTLVEWHAAHHAYNAAIPHAQRWLAQDPLHEAAHRTLMRLYAQTGQRAAALRQYEQCVERLDDELGIAPDEKTKTLYADIRAGHLSPSVEMESVEMEVDTDGATTPPHNLPCPPTPLVGREQELAELAERLTDPQVRLITIVGAGGMGKSRLALAAAEHALAHFPDGVYLVPLVGVDNSTGLAPALAATLGLDDADGGSNRQRLVYFLRDKRLLLLLDNFEHLLDGAEFLAKLLQAAPYLTLLVTSRERLALQEEWLFPLSGLDYPPSEDAQNNGASPAVELFARCARKVRPDFSLNEEWPGVAAICQLVEGMPLGIELAATWARLMTCAEIAAELASDLDLLSTSMRNRPEQHRSLRTVFERSWTLLCEEEQRGLRRLSIFRGGFEKKAAAAVADADPRLLAPLVDRSLIRWQPGSDRFDMHELLRQFAAEKLESQPGEGEAIQGRHATYYAAFLHERAEALTAARQVETLSEIRREMDNVRKAWHWAVANRSFAVIEQAVQGLGLFYEKQGWLQEGIEALDRAMSMVEAQNGGESANHHQTTNATSNRIRVQLLERLGWMKWALGEHGAAHQDFEAGLRLSQEMGDREHAAEFMRALGVMAWDVEMPNKAHPLLQNARTIQQELDDRRGQARTLQNLGLVAEQQERYPQARQYYVDSLDLSRAVGDRYHAGYALNNLAFLLGLEGRYAEAEQRCREALAVADELDNQKMRTTFLCNLGFILFHRGQHAHARHCFDESLQSAMKIGGTTGALETLVGFAYLETQAGKTARALQLLGLVINHAIKGHDVNVRAEPLLAQLQDHCAPDFVTAELEAGRWLDLDTVAREILAGT